MAEIKLNQEESEKMFFDSLCNGAGYLGGYGISLDFVDGEYAKAKESLKAENPDKVICREDIWMRILKDGGTLIFEDEEAEERHEIKLSDVHEKVQQTPFRHLVDMINEQDDAVTADCILQTVIFGEIVYG